MKIIIPIEPTTQQRARHSKFGSYKAKPQKISEYKIINHLEKHRPDVLLTGYIVLLVEVYFSRPKSHYRTGKFSDIMKIDAPKYCNKTPDYDNLAKQIGDCGTGIIWEDDRFIVDGRVVKMYTNNHEPKWVINISQVQR